MCNSGRVHFRAMDISTPYNNVVVANEVRSGESFSGTARSVYKLDQFHAWTRREIKRA